VTAIQCPQPTILILDRCTNTIDDESDEADDGASCDRWRGVDVTGCLNHVGLIRRQYCTVYVCGNTIRLGLTRPAAAAAAAWLTNSNITIVLVLVEFDVSLDTHYT